MLDKLRFELSDELGYDVFKIDTLEADDIISVLALKYPGPHIVISNDKDFFQLQIKKDVDMYSPMKSSKLKCQNPKAFLLEHIIRGDKGDGVPNILSDLNSFVTGKRQKSIRNNKLQEWIAASPENVFDTETLQRYKENKTLISLIDLPDFVVDKITLEYVKKHIAPLDVIVNLDETNYTICAYLDSDKDDEDLLLGDHTLILWSGDNPQEAIFSLEG